MTITSLPLSTLSQDEEDLVDKMSAEVNERKFRLELHNAYYDGLMRIASLGISVPPQLERLHTVIGWPRIVVDSLDERLDVEGFRFSDGVDADTDLWDIWQANNLDEESQLAHLDGLVYGSAFITVGTNDDPSGQPIMAVESPLDLACRYDARTRTITSAFRLFTFQRQRQATLYLPNETISLSQSATGSWLVLDRDQHNLGQVPVVRMANRARITDRYGRSEITPEIVSLTDAACRTLMSLEVAREFYAAPQRYILGASESAFQGPDGTPKSAWETYLGKVLALERDEDGNVPTVGQFTPYNPDAFTKVIDTYAKIITSITGLPSEYLGITTVNPSSADAIRMNSDRLINKVKRKQRSFEGAWEDAMRLALLIRDNHIPDEAKSMETLWRSPEIPTPDATSQAIFRQIQGGSIPPTSDPVLARLGWTALERQRLAADRLLDQGASVLAELATSLIAKEARVDKSLAGDIASGANVPGTPKVATPPGMGVAPSGLMVPKTGKASRMPIPGPNG